MLFCLQPRAHLNKNSIQFNAATSFRHTRIFFKQNKVYSTYLPCENRDSTVLKCLNEKFELANILAVKKC
jgi:hypothetical protein